MLYERGPTLTLWWLDAYLDLRADQRKHARAGLTDWFRWHRRNELPAYAALLDGLARDADGRLTAARVCAVNDSVRSHVGRGLEQAVPALATLASTLDATQRTHLARKYAEANEEKRDEELGGTAAERRADDTRRAVDLAQDLYGRLNREQKALIARWVANSPYDPRIRLAERSARQEETLAALARIGALQPPSDAAARAVLQALVAGFLHSPRADYRAYQARLVAYNCEFIAEVHNAMSDRQRAKAVKKLRAREADFRSLAGR